LFWAEGRCWHRRITKKQLASPRVKGLTIMVNSISNGARMEDVWLDN